MARKYELITDLYYQTINEVSENADSWKSFLKTAGRNFRLRFDEQILIYAQRPDAIAVLEIEKWNNRFGRWVNKGAKGIAVFADEDRLKQRLTHYFDISDTHESRYSRPVPIWQMKDEYLPEVIETLSNTFGISESSRNLASVIKAGITNGVDDNISDYLYDLPVAVYGSNLSALSDDEIKSKFENLVKNSVSYMLMARLGIDADHYYSRNDFDDIALFNTVDSLNALGFATSDIAEMGLLPISKTINALNIQNRTIVSSNESNYNEVEKKNERSLNDERDNIYNGRRLQSTESESSRTAGSDNGQMGSDEKGLFEEPSQDSLLQPIDQRRTVQTPIGDSNASDELGRESGQGNGNEGRIDGGTQGEGYDDLGNQDEQLSSISKRNNQNADHLRLEDIKPLPSVKDQLTLFQDQAEESKTSAFSIPQEVITAVIKSGSGFADGKMRIYEQFQNSFSAKDNANFLKNEYGIGGSTHAGGFEGYNQDHDAKGLLIRKGYGDNAPKVLLKWSEVAKQISDLIRADNYLNDKEKDRYPAWLEKETIRRAEIEDQKRNKKILSTAPSFSDDNFDPNDIIGKEINIDQRLFVIERVDMFGKDVSMKDVTFQNENGFPINRVEKLDYVLRLLNEQYPLAQKENTETSNATYEYHLGDKVYIGSNPYEILSIDDERVMLFDYDMPLFNKEFPRDIFDARVRENPLNDHLIIVQNKEEQDLATRLAFFAKDFDFYNYQDNLDSCDSDEDAIENVRNGLSKSEYVKGIITFLNDIDTEDLDSNQQKERDYLFGELTKIDNDLSEENLLEKAKQIINDYCQDEFESDADFSNLSSIGVAYTETEDGDYPIQAIVDLNNFKIETKVLDLTTHLEQYSSLEELIDQGLVNLDFSELTYVSDEDMEKIKSNDDRTEQVTPAWEQKRTRKINSFDLHPEIPLAERRTFDLRNHPVEVVSKKERFNRNIQAIEVLKRLELENRFATDDEQEVLSKYVGWGGIPEAFDSNNTVWTSEYLILKNLLDSDEYSLARESTLTAFYTPPVVIDAVYKALAQMGFSNGNLLEPSCGIGNFIGMLPDSMAESKVYGVEIDKISAAIAQQLYQKSSIASMGYEEVNLPDNFFDGIIGNVPFGDFKVLDKRYDKYNFLIHDYFFAKSLDKLRPGGVMALITSKGTMDKANSSVRKYIAQRADLVGAIRLPNDTFKGNAGTEVVSDILFLQKRDRIIDIEPDWVHLDTDENGIKMNSYFISHPEMVLGEMKMITGRFGQEATCLPYEGANLIDLLDDAISNIHAEMKSYEVSDDLEEDDNSIPADPTVRNFSFTILDDKIYYRENSMMRPVEVSATAQNRIKGMIAIRDAVRNLIELQTEDYPEEDIKDAQTKLNVAYDTFTSKYGLINSRANISVFSDDSSYSLLSALEVINENGELERKADMFYKRTIKPHLPIVEVDTASEALAVSIGEKAKIDMEFMTSLTGKSEEDLFKDLQGVIFLNPLYDETNSLSNKYFMADEYLSGNVREKLRQAKMANQAEPSKYTINVQALEKVQPKDLPASDISVRLGATWIPAEIVEQFVYEFLDTPRWARWNIKVHFSDFTSEWNIEGKSYDRSNVKAYSTYGTGRINAYKIIEETLNLKDVRIFDYVEDEDGKKKAVLNKKETAIAQSKQELIKQGFEDWIWKDPSRRERLVKLYNERFNSIRPREYDGSHIVFNGMNSEITLREHQRNAVAHILYGGNTLLAHAVGAGKTFEMVAAAQESKRLGLCNKSLFVVPNHLTEQWAAEYLQLYPSANILVATKKDFETKNRKRFCGRIATGEYDAVIIGHSQFEKIPMSIERQRALLEQQIDELTQGIADLKRNRGENFSIKQLEKSRKSIKQKLEKLNDQSRKDDVVTFEELGVDRLFIDESHYYKNLFLYTKMRNVGGIAQTEAQKSSDLFMKCRYLDEITGGRGIVFATGTPISNSMVELYTIQRYLQYDTLVKNNLQHFDAWASTFGETVTAVELTPEGTGYRAKTRFAKFYNLPELMSMFKEVADIKTADMLELPAPKAEFHNIAVKPSDMQKEMVASLAERAEKVRGGGVDSSIDNMLKITNDGRKLALDQRMLNEMLPDFEGSKINACVDNIYRIWNETSDDRSTQLVFCDLSTPKSDGTFSIYNDIKNKLIALGVPSAEVAFIHDADTDIKKKELFRKVRKGEVRILLGSTQKMGAGTNVQDKLIALHDVDCPWRPSDLEQRAGRIIRQGNNNEEVHIYRYVTEQTFDAYLYQLVEGKQKFASQIMTSKSPVRSAEDIDETALSYAEIKMLATGNPYIKEKMDLDIQVQKLKLLKSNYLSEKYSLEDKIIKYYPQRIASLSSHIENFKADISTLKTHPKPLDDSFIGMKVAGAFYFDKQDAGKAIIAACKSMQSPDPIALGEYRGFKIELFFDTFERNYVVKIKGETSYNVALGDDVYGNITRLDNAIERFPDLLEKTTEELESTKQQFETAKIEVEKPFAKEDELKEKQHRLDELNILLNMDKRENEIVGEVSDDAIEASSKQKDYER
ncbi:DEAD/DEAH box helicase family protein [Bulleidia sp. HCP3S3_F2]|uniref:DEAD/DEAH box helicase family protein n=1 Tax=unclassified Bulleidia TaxID=2704656 RepID=UPI003F88D452